MPMPVRRVILATYDGAELIDISGPCAVFSFANRLAGAQLYRLAVVSPDAPVVMHGDGLGLTALPLAAVAPDPADTVLVVGGEAPAVRRAMASAPLRRLMVDASVSAERYGSICSGAFVLAAAGLLNGRRCATHWDAGERLRRTAPGATVDDDALYIQDGRLWTSAGVTTGIDMALAIVAQDHGQALKSAVARRMVVFAHRAGHQSQFSDLLDLQVRAGARFGALIEWLGTRLDTPPSVEAMASRMAMSPRSFHRHFTRAMGDTPARVCDRLRLDHARALLEAGEPIGRVAARCGFRSEAAFRRAFRQHLGVSPGFYRETRRAPPGD